MKTAKEIATRYVGMFGINDATEQQDIDYLVDEILLCKNEIIWYAEREIKKRDEQWKSILGKDKSKKFQLPKPRLE
jgi:hypothetical protein